MLAYLDVLVAAVTRGDAAELDRLLAHPMARTLTADALGEVLEAADGTLQGAPLHLLTLRHQTAQLLGEDRGDADPAAVGVRRVIPGATPPLGAPTRQQIELPLSA